MPKVTLFPDWDDLYLRQLAEGVTAAGWECEMVGPEGISAALADAAEGRGTVHIHWYEGFNPRRTRRDGLTAWMQLPLLMAAGRRGRLIWTVHNVVPHEGYAPLMGASFVSALAHAASRVLVHFDETRDVLAKEFGIGNKVFVTPPAAVGHAHGAPIDRALARATVWEDLDPDATLFVQIGNLRAYKDPVTTVLAFRDAAPANARLLLSGLCRAGSMRSEIMRAADGDPRIVTRFAFVDDDYLVAALCAAEWSICPYRKIDNPSAANLTISYGCPLIAPAIPVIRRMAAGHPSILYATRGNRRRNLAEAIALAGERPPLRATDSRSPALVTRRDQVDQTVAQYVAARAQADALLG
jgi:hypothetical protein